MKRKRLKISKYKTKYRGKLYEIKQAIATFPSGKKKIFERAVRPSTVIILAFDDKNRLLLNREYRTRQKEYLWRIPGGRCDKEKNPRKAALRELREETGYSAKKIKLFYTSEMGLSLTWRRYAYVATQLYRAPLKGDEDEDITVVPVTLKKAYSMVLHGEMHNEHFAFAILKLYRQRNKLLKF